MWTTGVAEDGPDPEFLRRISPPENEIPVGLAVNTVLARTDDAVIALLAVRVYTTGVSFDLAVRVRAWPRSTRHGLSELVFGHDAPAGRLLLGVELSDGRRASNLEGRGPRPDSTDMVFLASGGSGGQLSVDQSWWLSPLPPEGPVRFVVSCDGLGIEETTAEVDGTALHRAAEEVVTLWPWTPPDFGDHSSPPPDDLPDDSWFAGRG
jgi:hypothetical protein